MSKTKVNHDDRIDASRIMDKNVQLTAREKKLFLDKFMEYVDYVGEVVLLPLSADYLVGIFRSQGKWAGVSVYIELNPEGDFFYTYRHFGR